MLKLITIAVLAFVVLLAMAAFCIVGAVGLSAIHWLSARRGPTRGVDLPYLPIRWRKHGGG